MSKPVERGKRGRGSKRKKKGEAAMSPERRNGKIKSQERKLSSADYKEMRKELIRHDREKLGLDEKTAKKWASRTIEILKEVEMET